MFVRDIKRVGYERRTARRNVYFNPVYKIDETTFQIQTNDDGFPLLDEEFTATIADFRTWALSQEETLQSLFLKET